MDTPRELGLLTLRSDDGADAFLTGTHVPSGVPFQISADDDVDQAWVAGVLNDFPRYETAASGYLADEVGGTFGDPEVTFWGGTKWSIIFGTGSPEICDPFGILVDLDGEAVVGWEDLSDGDLSGAG